jgi:hypothetical protein
LSIPYPTIGTLAKATLIVFVIPTLWSVILPGLVAYRDKVFFNLLCPEAAPWFWHL